MIIKSRDGIEVADITSINIQNLCKGRLHEEAMERVELMSFKEHNTTKKDNIYMPVSLWTYWRCCRGVGSEDFSYMPVFTRIEVTMSKRVKLILEIERGRAKYPSSIHFQLLQLRTDRKG